MARKNSRGLLWSKRDDTASDDLCFYHGPDYTAHHSPLFLAFMGEVAAFAHILTHTGTDASIAEQVRFARARGCLTTISSILSPC